MEAVVTGQMAKKENILLILPVKNRYEFIRVERLKTENLLFANELQTDDAGPKGHKPHPDQPPKKATPHIPERAKTVKRGLAEAGRQIRSNKQSMGHRPEKLNPVTKQLKMSKKRSMSKPQTFRPETPNAQRSLLSLYTSSVLDSSIRPRPTAHVVNRPIKPSRAGTFRQREGSIRNSKHNQSKSIQSSSSRGRSVVTFVNAFDTDHLPKSTFLGARDEPGGCRIGLPQPPRRVIVRARTTLNSPKRSIKMTEIPRPAQERVGAQMVDIYSKPVVIRQRTESRFNLYTRQNSPRQTVQRVWGGRAGEGASKGVRHSRDLVKVRRLGTSHNGELSYTDIFEKKRVYRRTENGRGEGKGVVLSRGQSHVGGKNGESVWN